MYLQIIKMVCTISYQPWQIGIAFFQLWYSSSKNMNKHWQFEHSSKTKATLNLDLPFIKLLTVLHKAQDLQLANGMSGFLAKTILPNQNFN